MKTTTITAMQVRQKLGNLLELTHYQQKQFKITRKNKVMARLVSEDVMKKIEKLLESAGLLDTLALETNQEAQNNINQSKKEYGKGEVLDLDALLG